MRNKLKIYAVDLDKTLTNETCWTEEDCLRATPNYKMVAITNKLYKNHHTVIIYTARQHHLYEATEKWLRKHNINYSAIRMGKLAVDHYIDDKAINPDIL